MNFIFYSGRTFLVSFLVWLCTSHLLYSQDTSSVDRSIYGCEDEHLLLGNPSCATADTSMENNFLIVKKQYVVSYNNEKRLPNWVSWHVDTSWLGECTRKDFFRKDESLPTSWYHVCKEDYKGSGFDRGHLCPSADRTYCEEDNASTFLMTNIVPQSHFNNTKSWLGLENYCRKLIKEGYEVYTIAGVYGSGGIGNSGELQYQLGEGISIPSHLWKISLILEEGDNDIERINSYTSIIAVWMPNTPESGGHPWYTYIVSVDWIEEKTGYDFFSSLPVSLQIEIEKTKYIFNHK